MKLSKKIKIILLTALLTVFASARPDTLRFSQAELNKALETYRQNLAHANEGIVESAMFQIMILKRHYPELNFEKALQRLNEILQRTSSQRLRNRAFIAASYLAQPEWFEWLQNAEQQTFAGYQQLLIEYSYELDQQIGQNDRSAR